MNYPIQPIIKDAEGVIRFKANKIVRYLLDAGGIDLNQIALKQFPQEDQEQFAQLIGYSLGGFSELSYVDDITYETAFTIFENGETQDQAEISVLRNKLTKIKVSIKQIVPELFSIHPDDLEDSQ